MQRKSDISAAAGKRLRSYCKRPISDCFVQMALKLVLNNLNDTDVINSRGEMNRSPIFWAVWNNLHEVTAALVKSPFLDVETPDSFKVTILLFALRNVLYDRENGCDDALIEFLLISPKVNVNAKDKAGDFALLAATAHPKLFKYIPVILAKTDTTLFYASGLHLPLSNKRYTPLVNLVTAICDKRNADHEEVLLTAVRKIVLTTPAGRLEKRKRIKVIEACIMIANEAGRRDVIHAIKEAETSAYERNHSAAFFKRNPPKPNVPQAELVIDQNGNPIQHTRTFM